MKKNIPNIITILRLLAVPVFCYFLLQENDLVAGIIFIIASLSDILDGYLARKLNAISKFGKLADPFADKILQISAIIILVILGRLKVWIMVLLFVKDFVLMLGGLLYQVIFKITVSSKWYGKISAFLLNVVISVSIVFSLDKEILNILMIIMAFLQVFSLIGYTYSSLVVLNKTLKERKGDS